MTMVDMLCDVCNKEPALGVASTSIPYSCAFCRKCLEQGADPIMVFDLWYTQIGDPDNHACPDDSKTFYEGKYVTYREWYAIRSMQHDWHVLEWHEQKIAEQFPDEDDEVLA